MRQLAAHLISRMDADAPLALIHRTFDAEAHPQPQPHPLTLRVVGAAPGAALFLALHPTPIVQREPLLGIALLGSDDCQVTAIPDGAYYAMMLEVPRSADLRTYFDMDNNRRQLRREPIVIPPDSALDGDLGTARPDPLRSTHHDESAQALPAGSARPLTHQGRAGEQLGTRRWQLETSAGAVGSVAWCPQPTGPERNHP